MEKGELKNVSTLIHTNRIVVKNDSTTLDVERKVITIDKVYELAIISTLLGGVSMIIALIQLLIDSKMI